MTEPQQVIDERVYRAMALQLLALDWEKRKELLNDLSVPLRTRLEIEIVRVCHDGGVRMRRHWAEQFSPKPRPGVAARARTPAAIPARAPSTPLTTAPETVNCALIKKLALLNKGGVE